MVEPSAPPATPMEPIFFATPADFRAWLEAHHAAEKELLVGFHKKATGKPSITWPESVDEALCFGWIDGVRRSLGESAYTIRFTPRKRTSIWSAVNVARIAELKKLGRVHPAGLAALSHRTEERTGVYSFERNAAAKLTPTQEKLLPRQSQGRRVLRRAAAVVPARCDPLGDQRQARRDARTAPRPTHPRQRRGQDHPAAHAPHGAVMRLTLRHLRDYAVSRSLFDPTTLTRAIERLGFVQADPIRAPARAQDLTLRHRVENYRKGDLERQYPELSIEEDHFVNYGFLPRRHLALMLPRAPRRPWSASMHTRATRVLEFVRERGEGHPREVDLHFAHGTVTNYWGGSSKATTHLLEAMQYRGLLRVARREAGIRVYAPRVTFDVDESPQKRATALLELAIAKYAPLPSTSLGPLASRLRYSAPQLTKEIGTALKRARLDLPHARVDGVDWYWPAGEDPAVTRDSPECARLLAPFDPVVWDRRRFELFWYTPVPKRKLGYYALPLLWRSSVIGWATVAMNGNELEVQVGYVAGRPPKERAFARELEAELERMRTFMRPVT